MSRRSAPPTQIRVGGHWLSTIAAWGDSEITHGRNGPLEATWDMALTRRQRPHPLVRNAVVEIYSGPLLIWAGVLVEPDWDSQTFAATGIARLAEAAECLTAAGKITSKPNTAIDQAIDRQVVPWVRGHDFGNTDIAGAEGGSGVSDPRPGKLNELLDLWATEGSTQWRVHPSGLLVEAEEDEDIPDWLILPGATELGVASDDVTDRVFLLYLSSADSLFRTASYPATTPPGGIERRADITHLGPMTAARATSIAEGMYRRAQEGRTGWTNGMELVEGDILDLGGNDANLALVRGGQTTQLQDTPDPRGVTSTLNVVLDTTVWRPDDRTIQLNPVGLAARTWEQVMEEANARGDS